jgi:integrase
MAGDLACGTKPHRNATITLTATDLTDATCRSCRAQLDATEVNGGRLEALFVLAITLGLRPGELRALTWDLVNLDSGIVTSGARPAEEATPRPQYFPAVLPRSCETAKHTPEHAWLQDTNPNTLGH